MAVLLQLTDGKPVVIARRDEIDRGTRLHVIENGFKDSGEPRLSIFIHVHAEFDQGGILARIEFEDAQVRVTGKRMAVRLDSRMAELRRKNIAPLPAQSKLEGRPTEKRAFRISMLPQERQEILFKLFLVFNPVFP